MTKAKIIASGPAPKTKKAPAKKNVVETVVAEVKEATSAAVDSTLDELNEPVDTFTVRKSWLVVAAVAVTIVLLAVIL